MDRLVCILSSVGGGNHIIAASYKKNILRVGLSVSYKPITQDEGGKKVLISSVDEQIAETLDEYRRKGFSVYADESVVRFSEHYNATSLLDTGLIGPAYQSYTSLIASNSIRFQRGVQEFTCRDVVQAQVDESGKHVYRVDSQSLKDKQIALLLACYHASNHSLNDLDYLQQLNQYRRENRLWRR